MIILWIDIIFITCNFPIGKIMDATARFSKERLPFTNFISLELSLLLANPKSAAFLNPKPMTVVILST